MPVVILKMAKGRTLEQKREVVRQFTETLVRTLNVTPDMVTVLVEELNRENIGKSGVLLSENK
jgi:4-oxalocrotonate tautomerase